MLEIERTKKLLNKIVCMKKFILLLLVGIFAGTLFAQQPDETTKRALEHEIKGKSYDYQNSDYLYTEVVGNTKDEAIKMAKTALVSEINKEALKHPEWQFAESIQAKDVEYNIDIIDLMRGNKYRVIAYIKKENIKAIYNNKAPEVILTDKKAQQEKEQPAILLQETVKPQVEEPVITTPVKTQPTSANNTGNLLDQILSAPSIREIQKILQENKKIGKASSGTMDKLTAPEKAYLVVYKDTGEIIAILDKGSINNRTDLLSGQKKGNEILEKNKVIWFQLY